MRLPPKDPILQTGDVELRENPKRIRIRFGGRTVADSDRAAMLFERMSIPVVMIPRSDVEAGVLTPSEREDEDGAKDGAKGPARFHHLDVDGRRAEEAVRDFPSPPDGAERLRSYVAFDPNAVDAVLEEDETVNGHPRDPYHRVDTRRSGREVVVRHAGATLARSERPVLVFETDLPPRAYLPEADVDLARLVPSGTRTRCPYKGVAHYVHVETPEGRVNDAAWHYPAPLAEALEVRGMVCFEAAKLDEVAVGSARTDADED